MFTYAELTKRYEKLIEERANLRTSNWYYKKRCEELEEVRKELMRMLGQFGMLLDVKIDNFNKRKKG